VDSALGYMPYLDVYLIYFATGINENKLKAVPMDGSAHKILTIH